MIKVDKAEFLADIDQILEHSTYDITKAERKILIKAKNHLDNEFIWGNVQQVAYGLNLGLQALEKVNQNGGLTPDVKKFYGKLNADFPKILKPLPEDGNVLVDNPISTDDKTLPLTKWQILQQERASIFQDSGLCPAYVFIDDIHQLVRFTTNDYTLKDYNWQYYAFSEIIFYRRKITETYPYPPFLQAIYTYAANGQKMHDVYYGTYTADDSAFENGQAALSAASETAMRLLDAVIAQNKKNGIIG